MSSGFSQPTMMTWFSFVQREEVGDVISLITIPRVSFEGTPATENPMPRRGNESAELVKVNKQIKMVKSWNWFTRWFIPRIVSGLVHPRYFSGRLAPTYPIEITRVVTHQVRMVSIGVSIAWFSLDFNGPCVDGLPNVLIFHSYVQLLEGSNPQETDGQVTSTTRIKVNETFSIF